MNNVKCEYVHYNPNPNAKYGIALSFGKRNWVDTIFQGQLVNNTFYNKELIELSCCSYIKFPDEWMEEAKKLFNYIIYVDTDLGKENGTTLQSNSAIYPLMQNENIKAVWHGDGDTVIIRDVYLYAFSNMLLDTNKVILTTNVSYQYNHQQGTRYEFALLGSNTHVVRQFGGMFVLNRKRALETGYFPRPCMGHFEFDGYTHFINCGLTLEKDAIIVPRLPFDQRGEEWLLYSIDFHSGVLHCSNAYNPNVETTKEDRKLRLLRATGFNKWENIATGILMGVDYGL